MAPSLLERRRLLSAGMLPKIDCSFNENNRDLCQVAEPSPVPTSASSKGPRPRRDSSPASVATEKALSIDCVMIHKERQELEDPFASAQCQKLEEHYENLEKLGEGSCGVVYRARSRLNNKQVALKVMRMHDEERLVNARKEYELLSHVNHSKIIQVFDFFTYPMGAVLVLELFDGTSLENAVKESSHRRLEEEVARNLFIQLLQAVAHLHAQGIIHRDVKAENILVSPSLSDLRLVDFNCAKNLQEGGALTMTGTADYMPPEVLQGESPSDASDIWAAGLCLHLMLVGRLPSRRRRPLVVLQVDDLSLRNSMTVNLEGQQWELVSEPCKTIVQMCLASQIKQRPQASELLALDWLQE
jgi:serine/threonine protein kinase